MIPRCHDIADTSQCWVDTVTLWWWGAEVEQEKSFKNCNIRHIEEISGEMKPFMKMFHLFSNLSVAWPILLSPFNMWACNWETQTVFRSISISLSLLKVGFTTFFNWFLPTIQVTKPKANMENTLATISDMIGSWCLMSYRETGQQCLVHRLWSVWSCRHFLSNWCRVRCTIADCLVTW